MNSDANQVSLAFRVAILIYRIRVRTASFFVRSFGCVLIASLRCALTWLTYFHQQQEIDKFSLKFSTLIFPNRVWFPFPYIVVRDGLTGYNLNLVSQSAICASPITVSSPPAKIRLMRVAWVLKILTILHVVCQATLLSRQNQRRIHVNWGRIPRGGGHSDSVSDDLEAVVGVVVAGETDSNTSCLRLYSDKSDEEPSQFLSIPDSGKEETLGVLCDVVMVVIDWKNNGLTASLVDAVRQGAERRLNAGYSKLALVVLVEGIEDDKDDVNFIVSQLSTKDLKDLTPALLSSMDIVTPDQANNVLRDVIGEISSPISNSKQEFQLLFRQVHQSLTGQDYEPKPFEPKQFEPRQFEPKQTEPKPLSIEVDIDQLQHQVLKEAQDKIQELQTQQEDFWLDADSQAPLLQFGSQVDSILEASWQQLQSLVDSQQGESEQQQLRRDKVLRLITQELKRLYLDQLAALREHYGRMYETALEKHPHNENEWTKAAGRITENFRAAAQHAIPTLCQQGQALYDMGDFDFLATLQGLLSDMLEATESHKQDNGDELEDNDDESFLEGPKHKRRKWLKMVASKALMLGVNYFQGWLAWQGIKKAAAQRDKDMPKFPLF